MRIISWTYDAAADTYTLISSDMRCRVWRGILAWEAIISHRLSGAAMSYGFPTAEAARTWCETKLAERKART